MLEESQQASKQKKSHTLKYFQQNVSHKVLARQKKGEIPDM